MEILRDLHFINEKEISDKMEKEEGRSLPLHSAFLRKANYSALAATT